MKVDIAKVLCGRFYERCAKSLEGNPEMVSAFFDRIVKPKWEERVSHYDELVAWNGETGKSWDIYVENSVVITQAVRAVGDFCKQIVAGEKNTLDNLMLCLTKERDTVLEEVRLNSCRYR